ncbi:flexible cuticle protein 12-like [Pararge aegeria]|uniref:Jg9508 protein n=1 Tax=Pararge aegeria aegeria TaxID=348720 RepID=A0A8S4RIG2_9NEOP|nr:flexible cuticle protein 12-like [Pararge aegeria]CAH2237016.1 jg9508 [Pararge aegeria aegeria]
MKLLIALCLVSAAVAVPLYDDVKVLRYDNDNIGTGSYSYQFELSDGTKQEQVGELKNEGVVGQAEVVRGSYSWVAPDGYNYIVTYVADELGYRSTIEKGTKRF